LVILAAICWLPFVISTVTNSGGAHLQSVILGSVFLIAAVQMFSLGVLADLMASTRVVSQRTLERVRRIELTLGVEPSHYERVDPSLRRNFDIDNANSDHGESASTVTR
jgi:O-antigen ligase